MLGACPSQHLLTAHSKATSADAQEVLLIVDSTANIAIRCVGYHCKSTAKVYNVSKDCGTVRASTASCGDIHRHRLHPLCHHLEGHPQDPVLFVHRLLV